MSSELAPSCCSLMGLQVQGAGWCCRAAKCAHVRLMAAPQAAIGLCAAAGRLVSSAQRSRVPRGLAPGGQTEEARHNTCWPHRGLPLGCERLGGSSRARRAAECQSQEARRARRCGTARTALWHRQDGAISMLRARRLVEAGAGRDPSGDGVVLAQVVEREADDGRVQHVVRVRVDLRPWRKTREKYNDAGIITVLEIEEQQSVCGP